MLPPGGKQLTDAHVNINIMLIRLVSRFVLRESQRTWNSFVVVLSMFGCLFAENYASQKQSTTKLHMFSH